MRIRRPDLTPCEVTTIALYYQGGVKLRDIADAIDRPLGTVRTATFNLRSAGIIGRRYAEWDDYSV